MLAGLDDAAGLEAHDLPCALRIANVDAGVAVTAGEVAFRRGGLHIGKRGNDGGAAVKANLAVEEVEGGDVEFAGADNGKGLFLGLQHSRRRDGHVVVGHERAQSGGIAFEEGGAPSLFKLVDLVAKLVFLVSGWPREQGSRAEQKHRHDNPPHPESMGGAQSAIRFTGHTQNGW